MDKKLVSNSELSCFRRCAREHEHRYLQLRRPKEESKALVDGKIFHALLAHWWLGDYHLISTELEKVTDPFERVKFSELMRGYHFRWEPDRSLYRVLSVERTFKCPILNPVTGRASRTFELGGRLDLELVHEGRLIYGEHKTSSEDISPGSRYWKKLRMDTQVSLYGLALNLDGCLYDVIGKPSIRPYKATPMENRRYTKKGFLDARQREQNETPDEYRERLRNHIADNPDSYYQRAMVFRTSEDEREAMLDLWNTTHVLKDCITNAISPRNPNSCFAWNRPCDYFDVCTGADTILNDLKFCTADTAHEELL